MSANGPRSRSPACGAGLAPAPAPAGLEESGGFVWARRGQRRGSLCDGGDLQDVDVPPTGQARDDQAQPRGVARPALERAEGQGAVLARALLVEGLFVGFG